MREKNAGSANPTCAAVSATEAVPLERISCAFDILYLMMYSFGERPVLRLKSSKKREELAQKLHAESKTDAAERLAEILVGIGAEA